MYAFLIVSALLIMGPVVGVWPPVVRGLRGHSNVFFIVLRSPDWYSQRGQSYHSAVAREVTQWWVTWSVSCLAASPTLLLRAFPYQWLISFGAMLVVSMWSVMFSGQLALLGRAVACVVDGRPGYLEAEAAWHIRENRGLFDSKTQKQVAGSITRRLPAARLMLRILRRRIKNAADSVA